MRDEWTHLFTTRSMRVEEVNEVSRTNLLLYLLRCHAYELQVDTTISSLSRLASGLNMLQDDERKAQTSFLLAPGGDVPTSSRIYQALSVRQTLTQKLCLCGEGVISHCTSHKCLVNCFTCIRMWT